jgi:hypothetical protein
VGGLKKNAIKKKQTAPAGTIIKRHKKQTIGGGMDPSPTVEKIIHPIHASNIIRRRDGPSEITCRGQTDGGASFSGVG